MKLCNLSEFEPLKPAEQTLVDWLKDGQRGICEISNTVPAEPPNPAHIIRATLLRYLALGGCDTCRPPATGVRVMGAYILGDDDRGEETKGLDLEGATLPGDLGLFDCRLPDMIVLLSAHVRSVFLNGSHLGQGIIADRMQADGGVFLRGAEVSGEVRLPGARLGGDLSCTDAKLKGTDTALHCDGMHADGGVFLRGAEVLGEVRLLGARLGGGLDCEGAKLKGTENALSCDRMQADGSVSLRGAEVSGTVRLLGARLGGVLVCEGAKLQGKGKSLNADGAAITGIFFLRGGAEIAGAIDLTAAHVGGINDDPACWPPELLLNRCRYGAFMGRSPVDAASRLRWLALQDPQKYGEDFWPDSYEHCAQTLREAGHSTEARKILIEKERLQRAARRKRVVADLAAARTKRDAAKPRDGVRPYNDRVIGLWWHLFGLRIWDAILGAVVGYGRKPQNAAIWALLVVGLGWGVFLRAEGFAQIKPNLPQIQRADEWVQCADGGDLRADHPSQLVCFLDQPNGRSYPRFNALVYSIDTFAPVVSMEMQSYWIPDDSQPIGRFARVYLWIHIAMGWALTLLAVAGFSGLIKTDGGK